MLKIYQRCVPFLGLMCFLLAVCPAEAKQSIPATIDIPGAEGGVSFNDITYSPKLNKVIIPSGGTGQTVLIDPETGATRSVGLLRPGSTYVKGGPFQGVNSADEGEGVIFMMDRATRILSAWDIEKNEIISSTPLASNPDFIRYSEPTKEVWVTEPDMARIEVFVFYDGTLEHSGFIPVPGGLDQLVIDTKRQWAYTQLWQQKAVVIDLKSREIVALWPNACEGSHGLELDEARGFLFTACRDGKLSVLDADDNGKILGSVHTAASEVDVIGYNAGLMHVYLAAGASAKISVIKISDQGVPEIIGEKNVSNSSCVTNDGKDGIWVCDSLGGKILYFKDNF